MPNPSYPVCFFTIGFASSGKTTFTSSFKTYLEKSGKRCALVNLDPAAFNTPNHTLYNIRDHFKAEQIMEKQKLGANGTVNACLLLFSQSLTNRNSPIYKNIFNNGETFDYILVDTPGQIEAFLWSSATEVILSIFNSHYKLGILNLIDINNIFNAHDPVNQEFKLQTKALVSCYLYSCSIFMRFDYKMFNIYTKIDCFKSGDDTEVFSKEMKRILTTQENEKNMSHVDTMIQLTTENFFRAIKPCYISSLTQCGFDQLLKELESANKTMDTKITNYIVEYVTSENKHEVNEDDENSQALNDLNKLLGI